MKRGYDGGDYDGHRHEGPPAKHRGSSSSFAPRSRHAFKALCTETLTSFLLGSRGFVKDQIQQECNVKVVFSNKGEYFPHTQYRVLGVYADDAPSILRALEMIVPKIVEVAEDERARPPVHGSELLGKEPGEYIFRLCLSRQMAGLLIGAAGANIKQVRIDTGAKVFIDNDAVMGHRLVRLIGPPETLVSCLQRVNDYVQHDCETEEFTEYAHMLNFGCVGEASGSGAWDGEGRRGAWREGEGRAWREGEGRDAREAEGARRDGAWRDGAWREGRGAWREPEGAWRDGAENGLSRGRGGRGGGSYDGSHRGGQGTGVDHAGRGRASRDLPSQAVDPQVGDAVDRLARDLSSMPSGTAEMAYSITCTVPAALVGALVGRSGEFVRRIEGETGAKVDITREGAGPEDDQRTMSCIGPLLSVYSAHAVMMHRLQELEGEPEQGRRRRSPDRRRGGYANEPALDPSKPEELHATIADLERQLAEIRRR